MISVRPLQRSQVEARLRGLWRSPSFWIVCTGLIVAIAVVFPFVQKGWLLLLDWIPGPDNNHLSRNAWGLDGGVAASLPFSLLVAVGGRLFNEATMGWLPLAMLFPLGMLSMSRLIDGPLIARIAAGLAYVICPIMYERMWAGHIGFLLGYVLLPAAAASIIRSTQLNGLRRLAPAIWITALAALSVHFLWITMPLLLATVLVHQQRVRNAIWTLAALCGLLCTSVYLIPGASTSPAPFSVSGADLAAYQTIAHPGLGLYGSVAALYGFWRNEPSLPIDNLGQWAVFMAMFALISVVGIVAHLRSERVVRPLLHLFLAGVAGFILALGNQGPFGSAYQYAFDHLLGFQVMREPQKFVALLALFYAFAFGLGVKVLWERSPNIASRAIPVVAALLIPTLMTPTLFNGLGGGARPHSYPASWYEADRIMGKGDGSMLFLPWHQYMDLRFADNRRIGTPADAFFQRDVVVGDNVELPNLESSSNSTRSAYLEYLYSVGSQISVFGRASSPLGIRYIAVDHSADWRQYGWLDNQIDLRKVLDAPDFQLYENLAFQGTVTEVQSLRTVSNWTEMLREISTTGERADSFAVSSRVGEPISTPLPQPPALTTAAMPLQVDRDNPANVDVIGNRGGGSTLNFAEPFDAAWRLEGQPGTMSGVGATVWTSPDGLTDLSFNYAGWPAQRTRYLFSAFAILLLIALAHTPMRWLRRRRALQ